MPAVSKQQYKLFKAAENDEKLRKELGMSLEEVKEMTKDNKGSKRFSKLKRKIKKNG